MPARSLAVVALVVAVINAVAWLACIVPAVSSARPASLVESSGLLTDPVYVQDLATWLPLLAAARLTGSPRRPHAAGCAVLPGPDAPVGR